MLSTEAGPTRAVGASRILPFPGAVALILTITKESLLYQPSRRGNNKGNATFRTSLFKGIVCSRKRRKLRHPWSSLASTISTASRESIAGEPTQHRTHETKLSASVVDKKHHGGSTQKADEMMRDDTYRVFFC